MNKLGEMNRVHLEMKIRSLEAKIRNLQRIIVSSKNFSLNSTSNTNFKHYPEFGECHFSKLFSPNQFNAEEHTKTLSNDSANTSSVCHLLDYFRERVNFSEVLTGMPYNSEYETKSFNRFTLYKIYPVEPGLGKRVIEKPIGSKMAELHGIVSFGVDTLNANRASKKMEVYSYDNFVEGIYRTEIASGTHYELYFMNTENNKNKIPSYIKLIVFKPFGPPMLVESSFSLTYKQWINLILPLSGRLDSFRYFMERFTDVVIINDKKVYLTIVYFGTAGLETVKISMQTIAKKHKYNHMKLIILNERFSRSKALHIGALNWKSGDVLLFMCDVDIAFSLHFLWRCRSNAEIKKRVYYPIVFSLYNPNLVRSLLDDDIPVFSGQYVINKNTGFWRDFGYGMTCQYRSDFLKNKGLDETFNGWGGEDVLLYRKYVRSNYMAIRATDPGIFHLWHPKYCDTNLTSYQYKSCIRSKALTEASHSQLGIVVFKDEVFMQRDAHRKANVIYT